MQGIHSFALMGLAAGAGLVGCSAMQEVQSGGAAFQQDMMCGQASISLDGSKDGESMTLVYRGKELMLEQVITASGARYENTDDRETWFWSKGDVTAWFQFEGEELPVCLVPGAVEKPFVAVGNEPFWRVNVEPVQMVVEYLGRETDVMPYEVTEKSASGRRFQASGEGSSVTLVTVPQLCRDTMTGMPYPSQARLTINGEQLSGCGGNPSRLLMGAEWVVEDIGGAGIVDSSRVTVNFLADNRVAGKGSCNGYSGRWELSGESLSVDGIAATTMACPPALMNQERRFFDVLNDLQRFDISPQGALMLYTGTGKSLRAFQATN